jgi:hypothetical protein
MEDPITRKDLTALEERITTQIQGLRSYMDERTHDVETKLLKAFHGWARTMEIRVRSADERISIIEERVAELERDRQ